MKHQADIQRKNRYTSAKRTKTGFSIVEMLVAMTLGLLLTAGVFTIFSGNQRSVALNSEMANMQESMRFALNAISEDIRMAGYQGCADLNSGVVDIIADDPPSENLSQTLISGAVILRPTIWRPVPELGTGSNKFSPPTSITPRTGTHTLAVQYAKNPGSPLVDPQSSNGTPSAIAPLLLQRPIDVEVGDLALVSSCESGELFRVSSKSIASNDNMTLGHGESHNEREAFRHLYTLPNNLAQSRVMAFTTRVYFVADTKEDRTDGKPVYALYQQTMPFDEDTNPPVMLVEGVENMRILFGIGGPNGELRYVTANDSAYDANQIRSVRLGLLMSSYDQLRQTSDENTYMLAGSPIAPSTSDLSAASYFDDKRFRLAFNISETVRNRRGQE